MNSNPQRVTHRWDVLTIGETMAAFVPDAADRNYFRRTYVGAESNVAIGMANAGLRAKWVSRLGADEAGSFVADAVARHGVEVDAGIDGVRPTGVCIKELHPEGTAVRYYRTGSAASALAATDLPSFDDVQVLHLTGITPALSVSAATTTYEAMTRARTAGALVSYDLNLRPSLWPDVATARQALFGLVPHADVVFVGADEAHALDASDDAPTFAAAAGLRRDGTLVLKRGASGAEVWTYDHHAPRFEPAARDVDVVDVTGAGDAFAAGYLTAELRGGGERARLRLGHLMAARAIVEKGDVGAPLPASMIETVLTDGELDRLPQP